MKFLFPLEEGLVIPLFLAALQAEFRVKYSSSGYFWKQGFWVGTATHAGWAGYLTQSFALCGCCDYHYVVLGRVHHKQLKKPKSSCIPWKVKTANFSDLDLFLRPDNNSLFVQLGRRTYRGGSKRLRKVPNRNWAEPLLFWDVCLSLLTEREYTWLFEIKDSILTFFSGI